MRTGRLYQRILAGHVANVSFGDLRRLLEACGFELDRVRGSHHIFVHPVVDVIVNLQSIDGGSKPYQVRQVARVLRRYDLSPEGRS